MNSSDATPANRAVTEGITGAAAAHAPVIVESGVSAERNRAKLPFIQGLRGIAALSVAVFHCYIATPVAQQVSMMVPAAADGAIRLGFLGVDLFFAISGFVIGMTLWGRLATLGEWGRFFLRRQLRLDPPYWTAIAISILSGTLINMYRPGTGAPVPSVTDVIIHIFYLQEFLGIKEISGVFWTLCFEIQFYLFFGALVLLVARAGWSGRTFAWIMWPLFVVSILVFWDLLPSPRGLFISHWFEFFMGVIIFMAWKKLVSRAQVCIYLGSLLAILLINPNTDNGGVQVTTATALVIGLVFWLAVEGKGIETWLRGRVLHYLGDISYSLYLMHALVGIRLLKILVHPQDSASRAWMLYACALLLSVAGADVMFRLIERPSMNLSRRLKWR